jgi:RNA polymerase sigma-70 factor (ECF subfamily)
LHAAAPNFEATDWPAVLCLYDVLLQRQPSALVALNRAIAVDLTGDVDGYVFFHTARADVLAQLDRLDDATAARHRRQELNEAVDLRVH